MKLRTLALVAAMLAVPAFAATVGIDNSSATWLGYMNVFETPANGGGYLWGSPWGIADLVANFNDGAGTLTLKPNSINDASPYWYTPAGQPGCQGNKVMEANLYQEKSDVYNGQTVTFHGTVLANLLTSAHAATAFVKDFAPDYSSFNVAQVPLTAGAFSISLACDPAAGRHVQWGFTVKGVDVWITDVAQYGFAILATPEPASFVLLGLATLLRRR